MRIVNVKVSTRYDVIIGENVSQMLGEKIKELFGDAKVMIVSDMNVYSLHYKTIKKILSKSKIRTECFVVQPGEKSKSPKNLTRLLERLAAKNFTKSDIILAFGGGVVGDLSGLAGALYLRGIGVIQMPTTLLAAVDSSVGGKTAVNLSEGKNLVGVYNHPELVLCDTNFLDTLPDKIFADGMAEVIKYGVIADELLFDKVKNGNVRDDIEDIIARCVEIKRDFVMDDEFDRGRRQKLNFGHTFGHAIEKASDYIYSHGTAVAMGMVKAAEFSYRCRIFPRDVTAQIELACKNNNLKTECPFETHALVKYICKDKKISGGRISFVAPRFIGRCDIVKLSVDKFLELLEDY